MWDDTDPSFGCPSFRVLPRVCHRCFPCSLVRHHHHHHHHHVCILHDSVCVCSQYNGMFTFGGGPAVSLLLDPGSSLVAVAKDDSLQNGVSKVLGNSSECDELFNEDYGDNNTGRDTLGQCRFESSYNSGEVIKGGMVRGPVGLVGKEVPACSDVEGRSSSIDGILFGEMADLSGEESNSIRDGIVGVDKGNISLTSQLYADNIIAAHAFGQCGTSVTDNGSFATFGPYTPNGPYQTMPLYTGEETSALGGSLGAAFKKAAEYILDDTRGYYTVFSGMEVDGMRVKNASYENLPISFDTGTPSLVLPKEYVRAMVSHVKERAKRYGYSVIESTIPDIGDQLLVFPEGESGELDPAVVPDIFPNITLVLAEGNANVTLPPEAYVSSSEYQGQQVFSWKIAVLGSSDTVSTEAGLFLGVPFVYERYVQADVSNSTLMVTDSIPGCVFPEQIPQDSSSLDDDGDSTAASPSTSATVGTTTMHGILMFAFWMTLYYIFF